MRSVPCKEISSTVKVYPAPRSAAGRLVGCLTSLRWDYRERFGDEPQFDARRSVLILRSARAVEVPQIRASVRAFRRMRRGPASPGCAYLVLLWVAIRAYPQSTVALISCCHPAAYGKAAGASCARPPPVFLLLFTGKAGASRGSSRSAILDRRRPSRHACGRARR
jgi:hypothetical protein